MSNVAIYSRISTDSQEVQGQLQSCRDFAKSQGWQVVEEIVDVCSGSKGAKERPGLARLMTLCHQRKIDTVLFWSLDRLSREGSRQTIAYLTHFDQCGVKWHSFSEQYISSVGIFADVVISILSILGKQERLRISERTKSALQIVKAKLQAEGKRLGRPDTAKHLIESAKKLRGDGLSYGAISKEMGVCRSRAHQLVHMAG